jgi:hypothetical protein
MAVLQDGGAGGGAVGDENGPGAAVEDAGLAEVVRCWPGLADEVRQRVLAIVRE